MTDIVETIAKRAMASRATRIPALIGSNSLIRTITEPGRVVMKTHTRALGTTYILSHNARPLDVGMVERLIVKGVLVENGDGLFGAKTTQTYRLAASWGGAQ